MRTKILAALAATTAMICSSSAFAGGFYVQEVSSSSAGMANAGAAALPRDASVIFHNPSAIVHLDGAQVNGAVHFLYTHADVEDQGSVFDANGAAPGGAVATSLVGYGADGGNPGGLSELPNFYGAMPVTENFWLGLGVTTPWGLSPNYDDDFFGAFVVSEVALSVIDITPSAAYRVNDMLSIGFSPIIQRADLNYKFVLNPAQATPKTEVDADDIAFGYKVSATLTPTDDLTIGLQYRSGTNLDFEGSVKSQAFTGSLAQFDATGKLNLPEIATLGIAYDVNDEWTVTAGAEWFGWDATDITTIENAAADLPVLFLYEETWNFSAGVEYTHSDEWTFRAGYQYDETPTTAAARSPLNPDANRHWFAVGATQTWDEQWSFDYALTYIAIGDANIDRSLTNDTRIVARSEDNYAAIAAFGVNYKF